ncbi:hypothetical protein [Streptomyces sp. NPDC054961]
MFKDKLYMAHTGRDGAVYVCSYPGSGGWGEVTQVPHAHTERAPSLTVDGPNVPVAARTVRVALPPAPRCP